MSSPPAGLQESHDRAAGTLVWTLCNHARRNAVSPDALRYIASRCSALRGEVVVLTGSGSATFCSGFDLTALRESASTSTAMPDVPLIEAAAAMQQAEATFVASINGITIGAGVELVSACDFRIASTTASFRIPAAKLGVVYHARGVQRIRAAFGAGLSARMLLLGETVPATEALRAGAALVVVPPDDLQTATEATIAALRAGQPVSIAGNRTLLRALDAGPTTEDFLRDHEYRRASAYRDLAAANGVAGADPGSAHEPPPE